MTVWIYVDTRKHIGDVDHLKEFASEDAVNMCFAEHDSQGRAFEYRVANEPPTEAASIVPDALAALATFEKANGLTLLGIKKLMGKLQGRRTRRAVKKTIPRLGRLIALHVHNLASH